MVTKLLLNLLAVQLNKAHAINLQNKFAMNFVVNSQQAKLLSKWSKIEILQPRKDASEEHRLGFGRRPTAAEVCCLGGIDLAGIWWGEDGRALCCTAGCWVMIVAFDESLK